VNNDRASSDQERRLAELRDGARLSGHVGGEGIVPVGSPLPVRANRAEGYYGQPMLKAPVWTWEVPAYFFVGGAAGAAAAVGAVAHAAGANPALVRDARWIAATGAIASPPLLISDLGRPERFLNMLRVFKLQSPMSVGAWTLAAFSTAAGAAALADLLDRRYRGRIPLTILGNAAETLSAATGVVLSTYTGVLIGATAIPVWSQNVGLLPFHFGASSVGTAVSLLELLGHRERALNRLAIGAAAVETLIGLTLERGDRPGLDPIRHGYSGAIARTAGVLSGPVPLALRLLAPRSSAVRTMAALSTIAGSFLTRLGWIEAGRESAQEPSQTPRA
jgi:hypothetical protein